MTAIDQTSALLALLRGRPDGLTWSEIAAEVAFVGDAHRVWERVAVRDSLLVDPNWELELKRAEDEVEAWLASGLRLATVLDREYPQRLLDIRETPPFLFYSGLLLPDDPGMSVVGSRNSSKRGESITQAAAELLVDRGLSVIAGLAEGIDTIAHQSTLDLGGRTVAFIGTGITKCFPAKNRPLQDTVAERGLLLSQFLPAAPPTKHTFPMRNAIMSGYGLATIVVEAGEHSGTRIQARKAVEHGRPVILTDLVVDATKWGADLVGQPGVYVANGINDLETAVDSVLESRGSLERALAGLSESPAV